MKILHLSTSVRGGGAAIAARRLQQALEGSVMLTADPAARAPGVSSAYDHLPRLNRYLLTRSLRREAASQPAAVEYWSDNWLPNGLHHAVEGLQPDVVHLHWVGGGFLPVQSIGRLQVPIIWTLHDMWAFTGGCHYSAGCNRYEAQCGACPQLDAPSERDRSRRGWRSKQTHYLPMRIVCPSHWLADCARQSSLLGGMPITVIPNGVDLERFRPFDQGFARDVFGLPQGRPIVLFGAMNSTSTPRKGFDHLRAALAHLPDDGVTAVIFGAEGPLPDLPLPSISVGVVRDERSMALLYAAADVFVAPSVEDNLPNTVVEALACSTPAVAFRVGGMPDLITHRETGYLATPFEAGDLAAGIAYVLQHDLRSAARHAALTHFDIDRMADTYRKLYRSAVDSTVA